MANCLTQRRKDAKANHVFAFDAFLPGWTQLSFLPIAAVYPVCPVVDLPPPLGRTPHRLKPGLPTRGGVPRVHRLESRL